VTVGKVAMTNQKLQAALDELERLCGTVTEYKRRSADSPNPDSDVGRAMDSLSVFSSELQKLEIAKVVR
jgi:hypothetical protein